MLKHKISKIETTQQVLSAVHRELPTNDLRASAFWNCWRASLSLIELPLAFKQNVTF